MGLQYLRARYYDPATGRFLTKDPVAGVATRPPSQHAYGYALNSPTNYTDPRGEYVDTVLDAAFIAYDLYRIGADNVFGDCDNLGENLTALGADVVGAALPFATGLGTATRVGRAARGAGAMPSTPSSRILVSTPSGHTVAVPNGWVARTADNGKGVVYQKPGAAGNADMIRIMDPTASYPSGYVRYYNQHGQPLDVLGKPGDQASTHIPLDSLGQIPGWPTR